MKQTIEIEVPDGKKAVWKDNKIVFEDIKPPLPKTWREFCEIYNKTTGEFWINNGSVISKQTEICVKRSIHSDKNLLPSEKAAEQHLALMQLHQLRDCYRQGWTPDWKNYTTKYVIKNCYYTDTKCIEPKIIDAIYRYNFLAFPTFKLAEKFLNNFKDLIEQAGDLI